MKYTKFTVIVTGTPTEPDDEIRSAHDWAGYLLGEVTYRVENETPDGLDVHIEVAS